MFISEFTVKLINQYTLAGLGSNDISTLNPYQLQCYQRNNSDWIERVRAPTDHAHDLGPEAETL